MGVNHETSTSNIDNFLRICPGAQPEHSQEILDLLRQASTFNEFRTLHSKFQFTSQGPREFLLWFYKSLWKQGLVDREAVLSRYRQDKTFAKIPTDLIAQIFAGDLQTQFTTPELNFFLDQAEREGKLISGRPRFEEITLFADDAAAAMLEALRKFLFE